MKGVAFLALLFLSGIAWLGPRSYAAARLRWEIWRLERNPDERYRLAERTYQAGDYGKARLCCMAVLQREPSHAPANALRAEVEFILGMGSTFPQVDSNKYFIDSMGVVAKAMEEIDVSFARADRALADGDPAVAERDLRKILEYAKWLPTGVEIASRTKRAKERLDSMDVRRCDR